MKIYDCSSLLVLAAHFSSFSALPSVQENCWKWREMSSKDEQWRVMTSNHIFSWTTGHIWSNKNDLDKKSCWSSEKERNWHFYLWFWWAGDHFSRKMRVKTPSSLVFWTLIRFLIQICFIGPHKCYSLWNNMIARHYSSLLVLTAHFQEFSSLFPYHQKGKKWRKMTSKDE